MFSNVSKHTRNDPETKEEKKTQAKREGKREEKAATKLKATENLLSLPSNGTFCLND